MENLKKMCRSLKRDISRARTNLGEVHDLKMLGSSYELEVDIERREELHLLVSNLKNLENSIRGDSENLLAQISQAIGEVENLLELFKQ